MREGVSWVVVIRRVSSVECQLRSVSLLGVEEKGKKDSDGRTSLLSENLHTTQERVSPVMTVTGPLTQTD